jgi:SOS response regulatory protein OraA/RecX
MADVDLSDLLVTDVDLSDIVDGRKAGVRAALIDIMSNKTRGSSPNIRRQTKHGATDRAVEGLTLGASNILDAGLGAGITALQRAVPGGKSPNYTAQDYFDAVRLYNDAQRKEFASRKPMTAFASDIVGAAAMPGGAQIGKFVVGKAAPALAAAGSRIPTGVRAAQTARAAGVGGATAGAQGALTAAPGQEAERGRSGALVGAAMAPAMGAAAAGVSKAAPAVTRAASRVAGRGPTAETTAIEKLQRSLRKAGVTPDVIQKVADEWSTTGGVTPAVIDILKDAGAAPDVLRLVARSSGNAQARKIAEEYAEAVVGGTQRDALASVRELPTGSEHRTPSQIRADLDADRAAIAAGKDARLAEVEAARAEASATAPEAPRARETGAAAYADELNRLYDESAAAYKTAYREAESAAPELAVVVDEEVRPIFAKLSGATRGMNPDLEGVSAVNRYIDRIKNDIAPGNADDWPDGEAMGLAEPLTVQRLEFIRQKMVELADKHGGATGGAAANRVKQIIDDELLRLSSEGKFTGDPAVVEKWSAAIQGYADHNRKFGQGLPAKLTARKPDGSREVETHRAGDVIFGASPNQASMNKTLSELGDSLDLVSPDAVRALQEELYGRIKPGDIPALRETTGGRRLLPEDLSDDAVAAARATEAAEATAAREAEAAEAAAAAQLEGIQRGPQAALELGEGVLGQGSDAFEGAIGAVGAADLPIVASGAKQAVTDVVERPAPGATGVLNNLLSDRARRNLGLAIDPAAVERMQAHIRNIGRRGRTAQELEHSAGVGALHSNSLLDNITPANIAYKSGVMEAVLRFLTSGKYLNEAEYAAALRTLTSSDPAARERLVEGLLQKYPAAKRAISPALARPAAGQGNPEAVEVLEEDYGIYE